MDDLKRVVDAILAVDRDSRSLWVPPDAHYRKLAQAAVDALGLTEEPEPPCGFEHCSGHKPRSRLVGPWEECD